MDQTFYLKMILERMEMDSLRPAGSDNERIDPEQYQKGIESLIYVYILTRPNITFVFKRFS